MARGRTAWNSHVAAVRRSHPGISFKQALVKASSSWKGEKGYGEIREQYHENPSSSQTMLLYGALAVGALFFFSRRGKTVAPPAPPGPAK